MTKQSKKSHTKQMNKRMLPNKKSSLLTVLHGETNQTIYLFGNIRKNNQNEFFFFPFSPLWYPYFPCLPPGNIFVLGFTNKFKVEHLEKRGSSR